MDFETCAPDGGKAIEMLRLVERGNARRQVAGDNLLALYGTSGAEQIDPGLDAGVADPAGFADVCDSEKR